MSVVKQQGYLPPTARISKVVVGGGFEPPKALPTDLQSVPFGHSGTPPLYLLTNFLLELAMGLEPATC